jgi:hypothetical protein
MVGSMSLTLSRARLERDVWDKENLWKKKRSNHVFFIRFFHFPKQLRLRQGFWG